MGLGCRTSLPSSFWVGSCRKAGQVWFRCWLWPLFRRRSVVPWPLRVGHRFLSISCSNYRRGFPCMHLCFCADSPPFPLPERPGLWRVVSCPTRSPIFVHPKRDASRRWCSFHIWTCRSRLCAHHWFHKSFRLVQSSAHLGMTMSLASVSCTVYPWATSEPAWIPCRWPDSPRQSSVLQGWLAL